MFIAMNPPSITFGGLDKPMVYLVSCLILSIFAVLGNVAGYWIGHFIGPKLFKPREGFWGKIFDPKYVDQTHELLGKYGNRALVLARFVPFVRTFITLIAGIGRMDFKAFITWTAVGGVIWSFGVTALGYFLGNIPFIANNIDAVLIAIVLVSVLPMAWSTPRPAREEGHRLNKVSDRHVALQEHVGRSPQRSLRTEAAISYGRISGEFGRAIPVTGSMASSCAAGADGSWL